MAVGGPRGGVGGGGGGVVAHRPCQGGGTTRPRTTHAACVVRVRGLCNYSALGEILFKVYELLCRTHSTARAEQDLPLLITSH
eukprot:COSAG02_NODE_5161_length_4581_cov_86.991968_2_plen_83_part_00